MKPSPLERQFDLYWKAVQGIPLVAEHRFHPTRKWRFDRAHTVAKVAFEVEGGVWSGGRHTRGAGFLADCEKKNEAQLAGWQVFQITRDQLNLQTIERLANHVRTRAIQLADAYAQAR